MSLSNRLLLAIDMPHSGQEYIYQSIVELSKELIKVLDSEGSILYASPSHSHIIGVEASSCIGLNFIELHSCGRKDLGLVKRFRKSVCSGSPFLHRRSSAAYGRTLDQDPVGRNARV